eukprot:437011_1
MATKDNTQQDIQSQFDILKQKYQSLKQENEALKQKELEQKAETKHSDSFWTEIADKCKQNDIQYIKSLIDTKTLSVNDVNDSHGWSLLHTAARYGAYEVVQLCISLGADITLGDKWDHTALDLANDEG